MKLGKSLLGQYGDAEEWEGTQGWRWEQSPRRGYQSVLRKSDILVYQKEAGVKQGQEHRLEVD